MLFLFHPNSVLIVESFFSGFGTLNHHDTLVSEALEDTHQKTLGIVAKTIENQTNKSIPSNLYFYE